MSFAEAWSAVWWPAAPWVMGALGAVIGSFANVCIHRLPRRESIVFPRSHCPRCGALIRFYDNVPVLSWLLLRGRCRACGGAISVEYPLVEALSAGGYVLLYHRFGLTATAAIYALFFSALLIVTFVDLHHKIIPDLISLPGIGVGLIASALVLPPTLLDAAAAAALGWGLFYGIALVSRGGMGGGDVKLIAMIGAFLGWKKMLLTILLAALSGSLVGVALMLFFGKGRKYAVPFGPFLSAGAVVSLFWGGTLIHWYLRGV